MVTYIVRLVVRCFMTSYQVCFSGDLYCPFGRPMLYDFVSSVICVESKSERKLVKSMFSNVKVHLPIGLNLL